MWITQNIKKCVAASLFLAVLFTFTAASANEWMSYQKDEARNGFLAESISLPLRKTLEINIGDELSGSLLVYGNQLFFTTLNGFVGSCSLISHEIIWKRSLNAKIISAGTISATDFYVATENGTLYCFNNKTGSILWIKELDDQIHAPLLKVFRYIYIPSTSGKIYAVNMLDSNIAWIADLKEPITQGVSLKINAIYAVTDKGSFACIDAQDGRILWNIATNAEITTSPLCGTEAIYFGDQKGQFYSYDYATGRQYFQTNYDQAFKTSLCFAYFDRRVICGGINNQYVGIISGKGTEMWRYASSATQIAPVSVGRWIIVQGNQQKLIVLDSFDGKEVDSQPIGSDITSGMAISNGLVLVGTKNGQILGYSSQNGDYQVEILNETSIIAPGESTAFIINIITTPNFNSPIMFSVTGFPCSCKGVSRYFENATFVPPGQTKLFIDTTEEAEDARYEIHITAYSGKEIKREAIGTLIVQKSKEKANAKLIKKSAFVAGQDVSVDVYLQDSPAIRSFSAIIRYSKESLYLKEIIAGQFFTGSQDAMLIEKVQFPEIGKALIGITKKDLNDSGSGLVFTLIFHVLKTGEAKVEFDKISARDIFLWEKSFLTENLTETIVAGKQKKIVLTINKKEAWVDQTKVTLDAPPVIQNGRTLVPLRFIAENLEAKVDWDAKELKITLTHYGNIIELWINKSYCFVNHIRQELPSSVPPKIISNRTFVPLRFVSETLNAEVVWDGKKQTITINYPK